MTMESRRNLLIVIAVLLAVLLVIGATAGEAQPAAKQVLLLQSFDRGILVLDHFTGMFRVNLAQRFGEPVNVIQVVVGPTGVVFIDGARSRMGVVALVHWLGSPH